MRQIITLFTIILLPVSCASLGFAQSRAIAVTAQRVALIIGNSQYIEAPLMNPVNDAQAIDGKLRKLGFATTLLLDASQRQMEEAIASFGQKIRSGDVGMFYYAGHGIQIDGENYLIPVDASIQRETDVKYESVHVGRVLDEMAYAQSKMNIVILDACRNNPVQRSFRSTQKGLAQMNAPTGTILVYATAPGSVAADGEGKNGVYTESLLRHIETPGLTIEHMLKRIRADVLSATKGRQVPWESSSLTGDFFFAPSNYVATTTIDKPLVAPPKGKPPAPVSEQQPIFRLALAHQKNEVTDGTSGDMIVTGYLKAFTNLVAENPADFIISASAYNLKDLAKVEGDQQKITLKESRAMFGRKGFFSKPQINTDNAQEILTKLNSNTLVVITTKQKAYETKHTIYAYNTDKNLTVSCSKRGGENSAFSMYGHMEKALQCVFDKLKEQSN